MPKKEIRVFIASPGDLVVERQRFRTVVDELNQGFGDGANVNFIPLGWEDTLSNVGIRSQAVINREIDSSDIFILCMHRRWGQDAPDSDFSSYTEEEFHRASNRLTKTGAPAIFVFFKEVDAASMGDPGEQLQKVLAFRRQLEESRSVLYKVFGNDEGFATLLNGHLRAYVRGDLPTAGEEKTPVILPLEILQRIEQAEKKAAEAETAAKAAMQTYEAQIAHAEKLALSLARKAARAASTGNVEEAKQDFAEALVTTANPEVMQLAWQFYFRIGHIAPAEEVAMRLMAVAIAQKDQVLEAVALSFSAHVMNLRGNLDGAEAAYRKSLEINEKLGHLEGMANQYGNIGLILETRGDLDGAEAMHRKSLEINGKLGRLEGMAIQYGNIGLILETRGDLDGAEAMHRKALEIVEKLGRLEGMAASYNNIGLILETRGDLDGAETMHRKALEINEKLGRLEGVAIQYGNIGLLLKTRGDLDGAETMHRKALEIDENLGRLEGMAADYNNIGLILQNRGDLEGAEAMHRKALEIDEKLGRPKAMAIHYGNIGLILQSRGDLDGAEAMHRKALEIDEKLGRLTGMAIQYGNIGLILKTRGDLEGAEAMHRKALEIDEKLGRREGMANQYGNIGAILQIRGDLDGAESMYRKSLAIEESLGRLAGMAADYNNLGLILEARGDLDGAKEMHRKISEIEGRS